MFLQVRESLDFQFLAVLRLLKSCDHRNLDKDPGSSSSLSNVTVTRRFVDSIKVMSLPFQLEFLTGHITMAMNLLLPLVYLIPRMMKTSLIQPPE
jgi:hypothetical protein